jgi:hypothetical protein
LQGYFERNPLKDSVAFNHYCPARYFVENIGELESRIPELTIENFEMVFATLNKLLK